jgi:hypothetical protein
MHFVVPVQILVARINKGCLKAARGFTQHARKKITNGEAFSKFADREIGINENTKRVSRDYDSCFGFTDQQLRPDCGSVWTLRYG